MRTKYFLTGLLFLLPPCADAFGPDLAPPELPGWQEMAQLPLPLPPASAHPASGSSVALAHQHGFHNELSLTQDGHGHRALAYQHGAHNEAQILQDGYGHGALMVQYGQRNTASIQQYGRDQRTLVKQWGTDNDATVHQSALHTSMVTVIQHGHGQHAVVDGY